jgi:hypothetical protein
MKKETAGFDISGLMDATRRPVWVRYNPEVEVAINHVTRERFAQIVEEATTVAIDGRTNLKSETLDNLKLGELVGVEAVSDWKGLVNGDTALPCTPENIKTLMRRWSDFARFVSSHCNNLDRLMEIEKEAQKKN